MKKIPSKTILSIIGLLFCFFSIDAQQCIYTIGGTGTNGFSGDGGPATLAKIYAARGITVDNAGNVYFIDALNVRIRKITPSGIISTVAGSGVSGFAGDGGPATSAKLFSPDGLTVDASGNLYISDMQNSRIRKVNTAGIINTIAGNGTFGFSGDGGPASAAVLGGPNGITIDASGNIYFYDRVTSRIRKINTSGIITTVAGNGTVGFSGDGGPATSASLGNAYGVAVDGSGNIYVSESANNRIRKINTSGIINTIAGNGTAGFSGDGGIATSAQLSSPFGISVDGSGNIYFCDNYNSRIRQINTSGIINTVVGTGIWVYNGDGILPINAQVDPIFLALDASNNMYISDYNNYRIRKITSATPSMPINTTPPVNLTICSGSSTTLSATGTAILGWYSSSTGGTYLGGGAVLNTSTLSTNTTFYVQDSSACVVSLRKAITVTVNPTPTITVNNGSICIGASFTIVPSGANTYTFSGGGPVVSPTTTTSYSVSGTSIAGCISTTSAVSSVNVNTLPTVTAISNPTIVCAGQNATLSAGGALTYSWSTGATTDSILVSPTTTTNYSLTGSDINNCKNSFTISVAVSNPQLTLTANPITCFGMCNGSITSSISGGIAPYTFTSSPTTNLCAGIYTVYATDNIGCNTTNTVLVTQPSALNITAVNINSVTCNSICNGSYSINATGGTAGYSYSPAINSTNLCAGVYNFTVTDANLCTSISSVTINQPAPLTTTVNTTNSVICSGNSSTLSASISGGTGPMSYSWSTGSTNPYIIVTPTTTTTFSVDINDGNSCTTSSQITITVNLLPPVTATTSSVSICDGATGCLSGTGAVNYMWAGPCGFVSAIANPCFPVASFCQCTYTLWGTDANGCTNTATACISVAPNPTLTTTTSNSLICNGQTATLTSNGALTYSWSTSTTGSITVVTPTTNTAYTVTGTDANGCLDTDTITQYVSACTGINELSVNAIQLYPNPTSGEVILRTGQKENSLVEIYNVIGEIILKQNILESETKIDLKEKANGIYFLKVIVNGSTIYFSKVIKQ
jgi:sugar lactone lactonase YvrE